MADYNNLECDEESALPSITTSEQAICTETSPEFVNHVLRHSCPTSQLVIPGSPTRWEFVQSYNMENTELVLSCEAMREVISAFYQMQGGGAIGTTHQLVAISPDKSLSEFVGMFSHTVTMETTRELVTGRRLMKRIPHYLYQISSAVGVMGSTNSDLRNRFYPTTPPGGITGDNGDK